MQVRSFIAIRNSYAKETFMALYICTSNLATMHNVRCRIDTCTNSLVSHSPIIFAFLSHVVAFCAHAGITSLMQASHSNHVDAVKLLLAAGADIEAKDVVSKSIESMREKRITSACRVICGMVGITGVSLLVLLPFCMTVASLQLPHFISA